MKPPNMEGRVYLGSGVRSMGTYAMVGYYRRKSAAWTVLMGYLLGMHEVMLRCSGG
jgi:hypothetical protein